MFAQLRFLNDNAPRIIFKRIRHDLGNSKTCQCCNIYTVETLNHILTDCPAYAIERQKFVNYKKKLMSEHYGWMC